MSSFAAGSPVHGTVLVTGAAGFIGRALVERLLAEGVPTVASVRRPLPQPSSVHPPTGERMVAVGDIGPHTDWRGPLAGVDCVVHLAARVHVMHERAAETGMQIVIIRPVLVYGPGVKANFRSMMSWLNKGVPLPLGAIHNRRSLVALDNLVDLILTCINHPAAAGQVFLGSDGEDLSTTELLRRMGAALGRPARLLPVPAAWLDGAARLLGKGDVTRRLCGSLQVDIEKTRRLLDWTPPVTVDEALRETARHFLAQR